MAENAKKAQGAANKGSVDNPFPDYNNFKAIVTCTHPNVAMTFVRNVLKVAIDGGTPMQVQRMIDAYYQNCSQDFTVPSTQDLKQAKVVGRNGNRIFLTIEKGSTVTGYQAVDK